MYAMGSDEDKAKIATESPKTKNQQNHLKNKKTRLSQAGLFLYQKYRGRRLGQGPGGVDQLEHYKNISSLFIPLPRPAVKYIF